MTELQLYKFITENNIEYHWYEDEVIVFIPFYLLEDLTKMLGYGAFDGDVLDCKLKYDSICVAINDFCDYFGINMENVFEKGDK